jgi:lycopene cyclase domain-containing protein
MWLYFALLISSISVPLILSFDKKLQFHKQWKHLLPSLVIIAAIYIACDIYLTKLGVWGFNPRYHSNIIIYNLPLEEWLFFIVVPYASIFLHESVVLYFPGLRLSSRVTKIITITLIIALAFVILFNTPRTYTVYIFGVLIFALLLSIFDKSEVIRSFFLTFLIILIPFVIVNAILTGSFIEEEIVWYNNSENLGIRFFTIPIEDFGYAFSLILLNLMLTNHLKHGFKTNKK